MRRAKVSLIYQRTKNLRAVQLLLGHTKLESTVRYLGIDVDDDRCGRQEKLGHARMQSKSAGFSYDPRDRAAAYIRQFSKSKRAEWRLLAAWFRSSL